MELGVQTQNIIEDKDPLSGFMILREAGFTCCDFSLNGYLKNHSIYGNQLTDFFDADISELKEHFALHKEAAAKAGIRIHQMHMPYPVYVPGGEDSLNSYLRDVVAPKSMEICAFLECPYIVIHGVKLQYLLGSEEKEWEKTKEFLDLIAPFAKDHGIVICMENLYESFGGHLVEGPGCDADKASYRIDEFNQRCGREVLGFCYDTGHANLVGLDQEAFLTKLGSRLKVLHIHDNDGRSDLHQIPYTFSRVRENLPSTDWEGFLKGLKKIGFDGVLSFETAPVLNTFPESMKKEVLSFIAKIGRYFDLRL